MKEGLLLQDENVLMFEKKESANEKIQMVGKKNVRFTFLYTQSSIIEGGTVTLNETHQDRNLPS